MAENIFNDKQAIHSNKLIGEAGSLEFNAHYDVDSTGSVFPVDKSHVLLRDKFKNFISLKAGGIIIRSISDLHIDIGKNYAFSVKGDAQYVYGGNKHEYVKGDSTVVKGKHDKDAHAAAQKLQGVISDIQGQKKTAFEAAKPSEVPCPTCKQKVTTERGSALIGKILATINKYLIPPWMPFDVQKLNKYLSMLVSPFLSTTSNLSLTGGKSCGHPNCDKGVLKTNGNNFQEANDVAQKQLEARQDEITKHEQDISPNANVQHHSGSLHIKTGLVKNDAPAYAEGLGGHFPTGLGTAAKGQHGNKELGVVQEGAMKNALHHIGVDSTPGGDLILDPANRFVVSAGSPGIEMQTTGHASIHAGSVDMVSTHGEMNVASNGLTILKGKNIKIDANDRSGDSGVLIDAKNIFARGKLSVSGDIALKGSLIADGAIYAPTIITRSTQYQTTPSVAGCNPVTHHAVWNSPPPLTNGQQATVYNTFSDALHILNTIVDGLDYILSLEWLTNAIMKALNKVKLNIPLDNTGLPTGMNFAYDMTTLSPLKVITPSGPGIVVPGFTPMYNGPHNHPEISTSHNHWHEAPCMLTYDTVGGVQANRPNPSHIPTPAPSGSGQVPGPFSMGDSCGGGGAAFANAQNNKDNAVKLRNAQYGITGDNAFGDLNYVPAYTTYNPDGSLNPAPDFSMNNNC